MQQELEAINHFDVKDDVLRADLTGEELSNVITSRLVFTWRGTFVRARLVARGFEQQVKETDDT